MEKWNPKTKKYINTCSICGHQGYDPSIDKDGFADDLERRAIYFEIKRVFTALALDEYGRCKVCAEHASANEHREE